MDYLEYAYLQTGRVTQAKSVLDEMTSLSSTTGLTLTGDYANAAIPARFALERRNWEEASQISSPTNGVFWAQAITWMAIGIGSARSSKYDRASQAEHALASLRDSAAQNPYWSNQIEVQRREVAAWIAEQKGQTDNAIAAMRSAAELEETMDKHAVTPGSVLPAREMLAELLLLHSRPQESLAEYHAVLKVAPNRFNALYGAASAAEDNGDASAANQFWQKLTSVAVGDERKEMVEARKKLSASVETIRR
jgi:tetratricopeptide (TPR) repeat protein